MHRNCLSGCHSNIFGGCRRSCQHLRSQRILPCHYTVAFTLVWDGLCRHCRTFSRPHSISTCSDCTCHRGGGGGRRRYASLFSRCQRCFSGQHGHLRIVGQVHTRGKQFLTVPQNQEKKAQWCPSITDSTNLLLKNCFFTGAWELTICYTLSQPNSTTQVLHNKSVVL
jgi:hypothetical protein